MLIGIVERLPDPLNLREKLMPRHSRGVWLINKYLAPILTQLVNAGYGRGIKVTFVPNPTCEAKGMITNITAENYLKGLIAKTLGSAPEHIHVRVIYFEHFCMVNFYLGKACEKNEPVLILRGL